ncbi:hypothetical protein [Amycolatopsis magusensis]|uniref:hypothetical protein n=1 Tax=Amycolatopsis magusensis TaxID=882444 RepID=UPI003C306554
MPSRIQLAVAVCSAVFTVGTALQNFVVVDQELVATMMRAAGTAEPEAATFTFWFRVIGCGYLLGNALGLLVLRSRSRSLWWTVLAVNATQALGAILIPPSMWSAAFDAHGVWGLLPSAVTDGGALVLVAVMLVRFRTQWGRQAVSSRA